MRNKGKLICVLFCIVLLLCACASPSARPAAATTAPETPEPTATPTQKSTPEPTPEPTPVPTPEAVAEAAALREGNCISFACPEGVWAQVFWEGNDYTVRVNDPELQESYDLNSADTKENAADFNCSVSFSDGGTELEVQTIHFKAPGAAPENIKITDMQNTLRAITGDSSETIGKPDVGVEGTVLTWTFTLPPEYALDTDKLELTSVQLWRTISFIDFPTVSFSAAGEFYQIGE